MKRDSHLIEVDGIGIQLVRKKVRNLRISIHPPRGSVRVAAPLRFNEEIIRRAVTSKLGWIRRKQAAVATQVPQSASEFVSGENHYYAGRPYLLEVAEHNGPARVSLHNDTTLSLLVRPGTSREKRSAAMQAWYRNRLYAHLPGLTGKWEAQIGVNASEVRIRRMKTRWGSCNIRTRRIWLNLELAKKSPACLEYVFVHELIHLLEPGHGERFMRLMGTFLPSWRALRAELNQRAAFQEPGG